MLNQIPEIQVAVKFIASCLYGKLPRRRADLFAEELSSAIQTKFQVRYIYSVLDRFVQFALKWHLWNWPWNWYLWNKSLPGSKKSRDIEIGFLSLSDFEPKLTGKSLPENLTLLHNIS